MAKDSKSKLTSVASVGGLWILLGVGSIGVAIRAGVAAAEMPRIPDVLVLVLAWVVITGIAQLGLGWSLRQIVESLEKNTTAAEETTNQNAQTG